jgi:acetyl-CoA carboxylase biotin carboxylase subunit
LLAKLIGYGSDRAQAISRLRRALDEYLVGGIKTNISLFRRILGDQDFQAGKLGTEYLDRLLRTNQVSSGDQHTDVAAIAAGIFATLDSASAPTNGIAGERSAAGPGTSSAWKQAARTDALRQ